MFKLLGETPDKAAAESQYRYEVETALAKASMDRVERRDPNKVYHKMTVAELPGLSPDFDWNELFRRRQDAPIQQPRCVSARFCEGMNQVIAASESGRHEDLSALARFARGGCDVAGAFVEENFNFYGKTLTGAKEMQPRWKRCVKFTDGDLGEALGKAT